MAASGNDAVAHIETIDGLAHLTYEIEETGAAAGDEVAIELPAAGFYTLKLFHAVLTAGTATTIQPELGIASGWTADDINHVVTAAAADAAQRIQDEVRIAIPTAEPPVLYFRNQPDSGADNAISTRITVVVGQA